MPVRCWPICVARNECAALALLMRYGWTERCPAVFAAGHLLNMAINALGSYVHTSRLQYVEFFGKFFEGGGQPFRPLRPGTKYVYVNSQEE